MISEWAFGQKEKEEREKIRTNRKAFPQLCGKAKKEKKKKTRTITIAGLAGQSNQLKNRTITIAGSADLPNQLKKKSKEKLEVVVVDNQKLVRP